MKLVPIPDLALAQCPVTVVLDCEVVTAPLGVSVAAFLLSKGAWDYRRSDVDGSPRAPFCMIGRCFECLVEIEGIPDRQGCMVQIYEGMRINRQFHQVEELE